MKPQTPNHAPRRRARHAIAFGLAAAPLVLASLAACGGSDDPFVDRSQLPSLTPRLACGTLAGRVIAASDIGLPTRGAVIESATLVEAQPERIGDAAVRHATPQYCAVVGAIKPVDPAGYDIRFQVNVPTVWNQKAIQVGGGGLNGRIPANLAEVGTSGSPVSAAFPPDAPYPISLGYASYGGDSGHQEPGTAATWAGNAEAWVNFGHAGLKKTHDAAFAVLRALYGAAPQVSYFMGTSQGGREALEVAQRYPEDYDGVLSSVPILGYTAHVFHKALLARPQAGAGWIPPGKQPAIGAEVVRQCDALDGLADGIISHYQACNALFDPARHPGAFEAIRCPDGVDAGDHCLSDAQIATIHQMHAPLDFGYPLAHGWTSFPGYGAGREGLSSWLNINPQPGEQVQPSLGQPGATILYGIIQDPTFNLVNLSTAAFKDRVQAASQLIDSTNTDLSRFFARGGKLIAKTSGSDYNSNPRMLMAYHDAVVARFGQGVVDRHVRMYVLPNANHGGEGVSATTGEAIPHHVDLIGALTSWVEKGHAPGDALVVQTMGKLPPYAVTASRPMCRYPMYPRYQGSGNPALASSFTCSR